MAPTTHTIRDPAGPLQVLLLRHAGEEDVELTVVGAAPLRLQYDGRIWVRNDRGSYLAGDPFPFGLSETPRHRPPINLTDRLLAVGEVPGSCAVLGGELLLRQQQTGGAPEDVFDGAVLGGG